MIEQIVSRMAPLMRLLRRLKRRPSGHWAAHRHERLVSRGETRGPFRPPPPEPRELIEVLGIGRTEVVNGKALTLLSLERYREGDLVTFRLARARGRFEREFASPELFVAVGPASATVKPRFSGMSGGGGGGMDELTFRYSFSFSPGMPHDATDWVIEVTKIEWVRPRHGPERRIWSIDHGPWRFVIRP